MARKPAKARGAKRPHRIPLTSLVAFRLVHLADVINRASTAAYGRKFGINNSELRVLIVLCEEQPLTVGELSRRGRVDKAWVSRGIANLRDRHLVDTHPHPTDSRMTLISLTHAGIEMTASLTPMAWERQQRLLAGLTNEGAFRVIEALERNAEELLRDADCAESDDFGDEQ